MHKNKHSLKQEDETNQEPIPVKLKREQTTCDTDLSIPPLKLVFKTLPKRNALDKQFLKPLPKLPTKLSTENNADNAKSSARDPKPSKAIDKNISQASRPCTVAAKTNSRTYNSVNGNSQANKPYKHKQASKSNLEITKSVNQSGKYTSQASKTLKEQKVPPLLRSKSQNEAQATKLPKLQPLLRTKSLGEGSDSGVSDSSDRILAWLADTSRINFKNHPVPNVDVNKQNEPSKTKIKQNQAIKPTSGRNIGKQKSERQKAAILERVETATPKSDILDKLLPKHSQTHGKKRYAPYKLNVSDVKHNKATNSSQLEQEKDFTGQTTDKTTASNGKISTANQNGLSSELTNSVARNLDGKGTTSQNEFLVSEIGRSENLTTNSLGGNDNNVATSVTGVQNVGNSSKENSLQDGPHEAQQFFSSEGIQGHSDVFVNLQQEDEVLSMDEEVGSNISIQLSESEVADMEIDNAEEFAKEIVQEVYNACIFMY